MSYQVAVRAAAAALKSGEEANWYLAQLTYENTRNGGGRQIGDGLVSMEQWCADVREASGRRFSATTGKLYKQAWQHYLETGLTSDQLPNFTDVVGAIRPNSNDPEVVHARQAEYYLRNEPPERRADAVERLQDDPEVRRELNRRAEVRQTQAERRVREITADDPVTATLDNAQALSDLTSLVASLPMQGQPLLERIKMGIPPEGTDFLMTRPSLRDALNRARAFLDSVEVLLTTGRVSGDVDDFLRQSLGREGGGN